MVHNSGGEIPQMNYDRVQPTQLDQMEQPDQIEQNQPIEEEPMADDDELEQEPQLRRSTRVRQPSRRYFSGEYVNFTDEGEPQSFVEADETDDKDKWLQAMQEEM